MKKEYLFSPGPTPIPPQVLLAMARPIFYHRSDRYREIFKEVTEGMRVVFQTKGDVLTFCSSGTGAMEAAVVNILSPGDKVIVVNGGKFGERWHNLTQAYQAQVIEIKVPWGEAVAPERIEAEIKKAGGAVKAVFTHLCETSTGTLYDVRALGRLLGKTQTLLVVDAVSGLGADELKTDEWGVDIAVAGSQKGLMIPPGLAFASVSAKAWKAVETSKLPKFYFSFAKAKKGLEKFDNPFTPPVTLMVAIQEALRMILAEGIDAVIRRHAVLAEAARAAAKALGLSLYSKRPANTCTAFQLPATVDGKKLTSRLKSEYGVTMAGGQDQAQGKIVRIAHLGYADRFDVITALASLEMGLHDLGHPVKLGAGLQAAEEVFAKNAGVELAGKK